VSLKRKFLFPLLFAFLVFVGLLFYSDISKLGQTFIRFKWYLLPLIITLTLLDDSLRFVKWNYFLNVIGVEMSTRDSASVFFGGLSMAITPGKVGELFKSFLIKQINGTKMSRTMPVVVVERLTDLIAVTLLASAGVLYFQYGVIALSVLVGLIVVFLMVIQSRKLCLWLIGKIELIPFKFIESFADQARDFYESSYELIKFRRLLVATVISLFSWGAECIALYLVFFGLGIPQSFLLSTFIFAFSSVMGAVSMLPGGIGVAEGSMTGIMVALAGMQKYFAVSATVLIRLSTLWLGEFVGLVTLVLSRNKFSLTEFDESVS